MSMPNEEGFMIVLPEKLKRPVNFQKSSYVAGGCITFAAHLRAHAIYSAIYGNGQSAERLAERGGFGEIELDAFYPEWRNHIVEEKETK